MQNFGILIKYYQQNDERLFVFKRKSLENYV
jgi:hypothetical protein